MSKRKLIALLLTVCMLVSVVIPIIPVSAADAIEIDSAEDFANIKNDTAAAYVITVDELDFTNVTDFKSIPEFSGSISCTSPSGKCVIKNLSVDCSAQTLGVGIIGCLAGGTVDGLVIAESCQLASVDQTAYTGLHLGMIVGYAYVGSTISNCENNVDLSLNTTATVGGIIGTINQNASNGKGMLIENCVNNGDITNTGTGYAGGILGYQRQNNTTDNKVKYCTNNGTVSATYAGGIVGGMYAYGVTLDLIGCKNFNAVSAAGGQGGGMLGRVNGDARNTLNITDCTNSGNVSGAHVGGFVGFVAQKNEKDAINTLKIERSINKGNVIGTSAAGGMLGNRDNQKNGGTVFSAISSASIGDVTGPYAGGIIGVGRKGSNTKFTIDSCYVRGTINGTGTTSTAGLIANINSDNGAKLVVNNTYVAANLVSASGNSVYVTVWDNASDNVSISGANNLYCITNSEGTTLYGGFSKKTGNQNASKYGFEEVADSAAMLEAMKADGNFGTDKIYIADGSNINGGYPVLIWQVNCVHANVTTYCTHSVCADCGEVAEEFPSGAHSFGESTPVSEATVVCNKVIYHECENCTYNETVEVPDTATARFEPVAGVYEVSTAIQLMWLSRNVFDADIKLTDNVTIDETALALESAEYEWEALGSEDKPFCGSFDGNGKILTLDVQRGLFDYVGDCTISNLIINSSIENKNSAYVVGGLADNVVGEAEITDITVNGTIDAKLCAGLVGKVWATGKIEMNGCTNNAQIWAYSTSNSEGSAGIVGYVESDVVGNLIENCKNTGYITASGTRIAGIVAGVVDGTGDLTVRNCINSGDIAGYGYSTSASNGTTYKGEVGGIVAMVRSTVTVEGCINTGNIVNSGTKTGTAGIVARFNAETYKLTVKDCINLGNISAPDCYTGIVGYISRDNAEHYEFTGNYSLGAPIGIRTADSCKSSVNTDIKINAKMSIRLDTLGTDSMSARIKISWSTAAMTAAGLSVSDFKVGFNGLDSFAALSGVSVEKPATDTDGTTEMILLVTNIDKSFITKDLTVMLEIKCGDKAIGYYDANMSFAAAADKLADGGYSTATGEDMHLSLKLALDALAGECKTVVMIGDSITDGSRSSIEMHRNWTEKYDRDVTYPGRLNDILGTAYTVINCGYSGRTMCDNMSNAYTEKGEYTEAKNAKADIVFIMLGTNDASPDNAGGKVGSAYESAYKSEYMTSAKKIIDAMVAANPDVEIHIATAPESYRAKGFGYTADKHSNQQTNLTIVRQWQAELVTTLAAEGYDIHLFDMHNATNDWGVDTYVLHQYFSADLLHPGDRGYEAMAKAVAQYLQAQ